MAIELFNLNISPGCKAVRFVAQELGIELKIRDVDRMNGEHLQPWFQHMNPQHCLPTIKDYENNLVLWESRAIMTYLVDTHASGHSLYPADRAERAVIDRLLYFDAGTLNPVQADAFYPIFAGAPPSEAKKVMFVDMMKILDKRIGEKKYLTGETKTVADLSLLATLVAAEAVHADPSPFVNVNRWYRNLRSKIPYDHMNQESIDDLRAFTSPSKNSDTLL